MTSPKLSTADKIILHTLLDMTFDGLWYSDPCGYYNMTTPEEIKESMDYFVQTWADESFDADWFPLFATKGIRATLDYELLAREAERWCWDLFVCGLFADEDEEAWSRVSQAWETRYALAQ